MRRKSIADCDAFKKIGVDPIDGYTIKFNQASLEMFSIKARRRCLSDMQGQYERYFHTQTPCDQHESPEFFLSKFIFGFMIAIFIGIAIGVFT